MEKLIELLNEYSVVEREKYSALTGEEKPKTWKYWIKWEDSNWWYVFYLDWFRDNLSQTYLISKEYWFIKWLVDNDNIETNYISSYSIYWTDEYFKPYENLLMDLARIDEPIEFLISILK